MQTNEQIYPHIATWVHDGWIEIGYSDYLHSYIRVLDQGGMVWEGDETYGSVEQALAAADTAIAAWYAVNMPDLTFGTQEQPPTFTPKQGQYLAFIHNHTMLHGQAPAEAEMQRFFKVTPPTAHNRVLRLEEAGLISRVPGQARSIRLLASADSLPALER
jgi:hypothetical protein